MKQKQNENTVPVQKGGTGSGGVPSKSMKELGRNLARAVNQKKGSK